jgi:hypothetical protein
MSDCLVFNLAAVALPIDAYPYNQNLPMQEHNQRLRDNTASLSIYYGKRSFTV